MCPQQINVIIPHRVNVEPAVTTVSAAPAAPAIPAIPVALPHPSPDSDGQESTDDGYAQDNHLIA